MRYVLALAVAACFIGGAGVGMSGSISKGVKHSAASENVHLRNLHGPKGKSARAAGVPLKHSARYLVAAVLRVGLRGSPLAGHAYEIEQAAHETHISPFFMVGASGTESSVFRASCSGNRWNGWGMGSCSASWVPYLPTLKYAFHFYGTYIRSQWPGARTPYDLHGYCGCGDEAWGNKTVAWVRQLFGNVSTGLVYP